MKLCPKSHPCPGKYPLVTVAHLCFMSACPGHGSYHLRRKSATRSWSSTLMSVLGSLTFGQPGMPGVHLFIFVLRASVPGDKSRWTWMLTNLAYVCPWASHLGHPSLRVLEWDSDLQLGMKDNPRAAAWAGLGLICCTELTSPCSASWIIISDIAKPISWGDAKPIWLNAIKKRLEQRERTKTMWCNCKKHKVVSGWVFLPLSG